MVEVMIAPLKYNQAECGEKANSLKWKKSGVQVSF